MTRIIFQLLKNKIPVCICYTYSDTEREYLKYDCDEIRALRMDDRTGEIE